MMKSVFYSYSDLTLKNLTLVVIMSLGPSRKRGPSYGYTLSGLNCSVFCTTIALKPHLYRHDMIMGSIEASYCDK